ncbi:L-histidine N(alpha)-methyltransferase [Bacteroides uniformis]|jgi:uncharacterized SAM-dependent methyltransferase|uniref:L-histidine N(alpha)-methyltransferase n=1 Tax=Bacteroides uniformis TaxID=820 RepID=UPI003F2933B9
MEKRIKQYYLDPRIEDPISNLDFFLRDFLSGNIQVKQKYFYHSAICAKNWIELVKDTGNYTLAYQARKLLETHIQTILDKIKRDTKSTNLSFISLGVGDGKDDILILSKAKQFDSVNYFLYDISYPLITHTLKQVESSFPENEQSNIKKIIIMNSDFLRIEDHKNNFLTHPKLFCLLGSTMSNFEEDTLLRNIYNTMSNNDYFLLGVDCALDKFSVTQLLNDSSKSNKGLAFLQGPLEYAKFLVTNKYFNSYKRQQWAKNINSIKAFNLKPIQENRSRIGNDAITIAYQHNDMKNILVNHSHKYKTNDVIDYIQNEIGMQLVLNFKGVDDSEIVHSRDSCSYSLLLFQKIEDDIQKKCDIQKQKPKADHRGGAIKDNINV